MTKTVLAKYAAALGIAAGAGYYVLPQDVPEADPEPRMYQHIELETKTWIGADGRKYTLRLVPREHMLPGETSAEAFARLRGGQ